MQHDFSSAHVKLELVRAARAGLIAKGVVYVLAALLALHLTFADTDSASALTRPSAKVLLLFSSLGLLVHGLWRALQAMFATERWGAGRRGLWHRLGYAALAALYVNLAVAAIGLALRTGSDAAARDTHPELYMLAVPSVLLAPAALLLLGAGVYQLVRARRAHFERRLDAHRVHGSRRVWLVRAGRVAFVARGIAWCVLAAIIAWALRGGQWRFFAATDDIAGGALGRLAVAIVALGLLAYGAFTLAQARYRVALPEAEPKPLA